MNSYLTVKGISTAEYTEKRSRFIANVRHCENEDEAICFINKMREKYWDARHNVFAYSILENNIKRFSDDGEPHSTAGKPVLDIIDGAGLFNTAIVVTRYFGGVLLGTGGLVRAYSKSSRDAVEAAEIVDMRFCTVFSVECEYTDYGKIANIISLCDGKIDSTDYNTGVCIKYYLKEENIDIFSKKLSESFSGILKPEIIEKKFIAFEKF